MAFLYLASGLYGLVYSLIYLGSFFEVEYAYLLLVTPFKGFVVGALSAVFFNVCGFVTGGLRCGIDAYQPSEPEPDKG